MEMIQKVKENKFILKMVVLGDVGVGKSNIIRRIMNHDFQELEATVGVEFAYIDVDNVDQMILQKFWAFKYGIHVILY